MSRVRQGCRGCCANQIGPRRAPGVPGRIADFTSCRGWPAQMCKTLRPPSLGGRDARKNSTRALVAAGVGRDAQMAARMPARCAVCATVARMPPRLRNQPPTARPEPEFEIWCTIVAAIRCRIQAPLGAHAGPSGMTKGPRYGAFAQVRQANSWLAGKADSVVPNAERCPKGARRVRNKVRQRPRPLRECWRMQSAQYSH